MITRTLTEANDSYQYTEYGDRCAIPMYAYKDCTFYALSSNDRGYFNMILGQQMWNLVQALQQWILANPDDRMSLEYAARKDRMKAWGLTGLAQNTRVARCCCFLQMAMLHQENLECIELLYPAQVIARVDL